MLLQTKKRGKRMHLTYLLNGFREVVNAIGLFDMGYEGAQFTWEYRRRTP